MNKCKVRLYCVKCSTLLTKLQSPIFGLSIRVGSTRAISSNTIKKPSQIFFRKVFLFRDYGVEVGVGVGVCVCVGVRVTVDV
jgi:hypothetical protein